MGLGFHTHIFGVLGVGKKHIPKTHSKIFLGVNVCCRPNINLQVNLSHFLYSSLVGCDSDNFFYEKDSLPFGILHSSSSKSRMPNLPSISSIHG